MLLSLTHDFQDSSHSAFKALLRSRRTVKRASIKDRGDFFDNKSGRIPNLIDLDGIPGTPNNEMFINGCFNGMIPNLYIENGCFTKHPFIHGCLGFQVEIVNMKPLVSH